MVVDPALFSCSLLDNDTMLTHRGFSAWITSEGKELEQFQAHIEPDDQTAIGCWIPSEAGKIFHISWKNINGGTAVLGTIVIDGVHMRSSLQRNKQPGIDATVAGVRESEDRIKRFQFSELVLTEDESAVLRSASELGSISLTLYRVTVEGRKPTLLPSINPQGPVHESSKKAGSHVVSLSPMENIQAAHSFEHKPYSPEDSEPVVKFIFRYRPMELLQANGIIPGFIPIPNNKPVKRESTAAPPDIIKLEDDDSAEEERIRALEVVLSYL